MSIRRPQVMTVDSGRRSPFCRPDSPATPTGAGMPRESTPTYSPSNSISTFSPGKSASLSPEKTNPFSRRPSQLRKTPDAGRASSPFAQPSSPLRRPESVNNTPTTSPSRQHYTTTRETDDDAESFRSTPRTSRPLPSPAPYGGSAYNSPSISSPKINTPKFNTPTINSPNMNFFSSSRPSSARTTTETSETPTVTPASKPQRLNNGVGGYGNVPQGLLRSMRESFEVLDSSNSGSIDQKSVADMLDQMGMDNSSRALQEYFPSSQGGKNLNLARYLDMLSGPLSELSPPDELQAAFEAFDVDDSGQIDVGTLRQALMHTAPEPGEAPIRLSEREIDEVMGQFSGRRAFGSKGLQQAKGKGDVFRYREFMSAVSGGTGEENGRQVEVGA